MLSNTFILLGALAAGALANTWTMEGFTRTCPSQTSCDYRFTLNTNDGGPLNQCAYNVQGDNAATQSYSGIKCNVFTIGSNWSGQFGPNQGFQTLSVVGPR